jgi:putative cell wall-binding protein
MNAPCNISNGTGETNMVVKRKRASKKRRYWSGEVTRRSNALDLEPRVFTSRSPRHIASSLKRSAETSRRRKGTPYQSAMSMLKFHINRAGAGLSARQKKILERVKPELRKAFRRTLFQASQENGRRTLRNQV